MSKNRQWQVATAAVLLGLAGLFASISLRNPSAQTSSTLNGNDGTDQLHEDVTDSQRSVPVETAHADSTSRSAATSISGGPVTELRLTAPPTGKYLPLESTLLTSGVLNQHAMDMLASKEFEQFLARFDSENSGLTNELTSAYRAEIERELAEIPAWKQVGRISCATDVCIATLRTGENESWFADWYGGLPATAKLPIRAITRHAVHLPGGDVEHRLIFTTSPQSNGLSFGPPKLR